MQELSLISSFIHPEMHYSLLFSISETRICILQSITIQTHQSMNYRVFLLGTFSLLMTIWNSCKLNVDMKVINWAQTSSVSGGQVFPFSPCVKLRDMTSAVCLGLFLIPCLLSHLISYTYHNLVGALILNILFLSYK